MELRRHLSKMKLKLQIILFPPDDLKTSGRGKHDVEFESHILCLEIEDHGFALIKAEEFNTMISEEDDSPALNGRLRPRKSTATTANTPSKTSSSLKKVAQDKPKRHGSSSKASPNTQDDLTAKADTPSIAQFLCPLCDKKFTSKVSFKRHTRRLHQLFINCIYCNYSDAPSDEDVMRHMVDNHPNQYFACLICNTRFNSTSELAQHKLTTCKKLSSGYINKLRKNHSVSQKKQETIKANEKIPVENEPTPKPEFNALVISCELKPSLAHDVVDIEDKITTNLILPSNINNPGMEQNTVLILDDIQWNKRMPPNFSFRNADADQILSRLGVVHRSPRVGESTRKEWLKLMDDSNQKFEKCFDTSFYSRVASNVQENLAKFLDGSFNFSPDPDKIIKTRKSKSSAIINTAEGFPILLPYAQYCRNRFDGYIPRAIAPKHKWKWDSSENEKNMFLDANVIKRDTHVDNCIITLVSNLDIWTQLRMRHKFEGIFCKASTEKSEKQNIVGNQLKEILESREIPSPSRAVEQPSSSTTTSVAVTDTLYLPSVLGLAARGSGGKVVDPAPAVLSGEWVRPRCYVCCACGEQSRDARALSAHVTAHHPNAQVQHYEIVGESLLNADILKHLYVPPSLMSNRTRPLRGFRDCTKCKKSITMEDMHQHMLDCAGDTPTVRRKCRSRLFGVRKRRPRLADNPITRKKLRKDLRSRQNQKKLLRARPKIRTEVGDAETIRKMIADLPAKRHRSSNETLVTAQVLRPRRKLETIHRNKLKIKRLSSLERPTRKLATNTEFTDLASIDEDDQPLKPKTKIEPEPFVHLKKRFSTRVVASRNKKETTAAKELTTSDEKPQDAPSGSASQPNRMSSENTSQRLNINAKGNDNGEGENRNSSDKNNGDQRDKSPGENRDNHKDGVPDPPQLKHSINNITALTANTELQLRKSPVQSKTVETPSDTRQVFLENEVGSSILDKPPLQKNLKKTSEKKRLSLLNCIEKIKSQQKGEMLPRPEMMIKDQSDNEHPNLSLLDPHPAVICRTRDESGAAKNVIPDNIDYQCYPVPPRRMEMAPQLIPNETIMFNRQPFYTKINPDLELIPPTTKPGRRRRKSSAKRMSPARFEYEPTFHLSQNLQQRPWNPMQNVPLLQSGLLPPPIAPQRLPYSDNLLMQLRACEAIKNGYPMQYKNMGFPLPLTYPPAVFNYDARRNHTLQRVETGAYPAAPPISPQTWARESAHMQPFNNENAAAVSFPPKSSNNLSIQIRRPSAKRSSESSDTDYSSVQSLSESIELHNSSVNLFMQPKSKIDTSSYFNNKRPMTPNEMVLNKTPDYKNDSENPNANGEAHAKEVTSYRITQSQNAAAIEPVPKSLYSNKKVFHERYLADHPHLSPSVPTESQAAKITTSANDSTIFESNETYTPVQNEDDSIKSVQLNHSTDLDLNNQAYIEVGHERDESETLLDEPDSNLCEQPLDLSGKLAIAHSAKSNDCEDIEQGACASKQSYADVPTDLSLKDSSLYVKSKALELQYAEKPQILEQDNATPSIQVTCNAQLCNVDKTIHVANSEPMSYSEEITTENSHEEACLPNVENIETVDTSIVPNELNLNEEIATHPSSDIDIEIEIIKAREHLRILELLREGNKNSDNEQITNVSQDETEDSESEKDLPAIILPDSAPEFNKENATTDGENTANLNQMEEQNNKLGETLGSVSLEIKQGAGVSVFPGNLEPQKAEESLVHELTPPLCDDSKLTVNTASLPISSILPKKRHSPSARMNSQEAQTKIILNQGFTHSAKSEILESDLSKKKTGDDVKDSTTKQTIENSSELSILNITPKPLTITKPFNEKTASLRAVRIKTFPSARKSQSDDLQQVSKESYTPLLDRGQRVLSIQPSTSSNDISTKKIENHNISQLIDVPNTNSHGTDEVKLRQSLDKVIKSIDDTKVQSVTTKETCNIETSKKIIHGTNSVTAQLPSVEDVLATEHTITKENSKEIENENNTQPNIDNYNTFMETSKPKSTHNNDTGEIANISNAPMDSSFQDHLHSESSSLSLKGNKYTVLITEPIAHQSKILIDSIDSCRIANPLENESLESISKAKLTKQKFDNLEVSDDDDVCLASMVKHPTADSHTTSKTKKHFKKCQADKQRKQKKTSKRHSFVKKNKTKKASKMHYLKSISLLSATIHKQQTETIFQNINSKSNKTGHGSLETVKVGNKIKITKEQSINKKTPEDEGRDSDNTEEINSDHKEDSTDVYKDASAKSREQSHHSHIEKSDDVGAIINIKDSTVNDAVSLQERNSTVTINEKSSCPVKILNEQLEYENNALKINDATLVTSNNSKAEEIYSFSTQIVPFTKKQLIFSKLLHEENKQETKQNIVLNTTDGDDDNDVKIEFTTGTKISTKRKKNSRKSKNKKRKSNEAIEKDELSKLDTNTSPKKRKSSSLVNQFENNFSNAKTTKLTNLHDVAFPPHLDSTSYDVKNPANKELHGADTDKIELVIDESKEIQKQPEKINTASETRTACYNRPINKLTNFASIHVKIPENYDPYDIDLEIDMAETKRPVVKRKKNRTVSSKSNTKTSKKKLHHVELVQKLGQDSPKAALVECTPLNDSDSSISDTPLQKYYEKKKKSKIEALKSPNSQKLEKEPALSSLVNTTDDDNMVLSELPPSEEPNFNNNNDGTILEMNLKIESDTNISTNSIDHSKKTNEAEINKEVDSVRDFLTEQKNTSRDDHDNDQNNIDSETFSEKSNTKPKKNLRSQSAGKNEALISEKSDLQLSSDKYMENFGFFSIRQPRNANILATKKISETYNMIENDDADFRPRERQRKHSHNESKKVLAYGAHSSRTTPEINNAFDKRISVAPSTSLNITETKTVNEPNPTANEGEVDLITAQKMLDSEEIRKLERDLYLGFKEAAEVNANKTSGFNYLRAEETPIQNDDQNVIDPVDTNADTKHVESPEPASPDKDESEQRPISPEMPESPEGILIDKPLMYPEEEVNIYEDKYDIIKRRREASANAKQLLKADKPKKSNNGTRKKKPDKKNKRRTKKPVYQVSQVRTKGALKGFDAIKISIATQDLNMPPGVSPSNRNGKNQKQKESTGKARPLSASGHKSDTDTFAAAVALPDIYEFQDDDRPVAKGYRLSRTMSTSRDKSRSSSTEDEDKKRKSDQHEKEKFTLPHGEGTHSKKLDKPKSSDKKRYKGKGKGKRTRNKEDALDDGVPRDEARIIRKDKSKRYKGRDKSKVAKPQNDRTADIMLAKDDVFSNDNNAPAFDNDEPFYDSDIEMPSVTGTSGFVPDRNDESSYDSDSSSPPLSSVLKGPYACTCLSEIDSDDSETERGCAHKSCRYNHLNAAKNAVMGKIFKNNAVRCEKIDEKPESPIPKPDLDRLFDSLLEPTNDVASTRTLVPIAGPSSANLFYYTTTPVNPQSQINKSLQEKELSNFDDVANSCYSAKGTERPFMSASLYETDNSKIDDAFNMYNFSENTEETSDNGRYVMVSEKPVQTEDPEQLVRPEIAQDGPDDVEPESSDFIILKRKNDAQKSRGTQTKHFSKSDVETSSHDGKANAAKIAKKNRKTNKKHKSHHKRNKTSEDEEKHKPRGSKHTSGKSRSSKTKHDVKATKTETNSRGRQPSPKPSTSRTWDEGSQDNSGNASGSPRQRVSQKGVAEGRARRKCTVGKQNVLAEDWSSSESDAGAGHSRVKGRKSAVVKESARGKKDQVCKRSQGESEERSRAPVFKLRARAVAALNNRARLRGLQESHGWIGAADSGKKLVSMLVYNKMLQQRRLKRLRLQRPRRRGKRRREHEREEACPDTDDDEDDYDDNDDDE